VRPIDISQDLMGGDVDEGYGRAFGWPGFGGYHIFSDPRELALRQALFRDVIGVRTQI
jgi:hypothetical protein